MRDFIIKAKQQKIEVIVLSLCFLVAFILNVTAIIMYHTQWRELYTQWYVIILIALFLYLLTWIARLVFLGGKTAWQALLKKR
jgi:hypothetical protein